MLPICLCHPPLLHHWVPHFQWTKMQSFISFPLQVQNYLHTIWNRLLYVKECQCINDKYSVFIIIDDHVGQLVIPGKLKGTLDLTGYGSETYTCQAKSPTWPNNTGKDSCQVYTYFLCLLLIELCILSILLWSTKFWNFSFVVKLVLSSFSLISLIITNYLSKSKSWSLWVGNH